MKRIITVLLLTACILVEANNELKEGVRRWKIKVTAESHTPKKKTLAALLKLPKPIAADNHDYEETLLPKAVNGLKEGDIITTKGWLHLVALENSAKDHTDGDYHIQIRNSAAWGDTCLIVEIPYPEFVKDHQLKAKCKKARDFVKTKLLKGKEPGTSGNIMQHEVYVQITGQLYFDLPHVKGKPRGKRGMKSYTAWELHPVVDMRFAVKG